MYNKTLSVKSFIRYATFIQGVFSHTDNYSVVFSASSHLIGGTEQPRHCHLAAFPLLVQDTAMPAAEEPMGEVRVRNV